MHRVVSSMCKCLISLNFSMEIFIDVVFDKYRMQTQTVVVHCDIDISFTGDLPVYRLYVGNELFTERTWVWATEYLSEEIVLEAPYGLYPIRYELLPHPNAELTVTKAKVVSGPGRFRKNLGLEIHNENA